MAQLVFFLNSARIELEADGVDPDMSLLTFIRHSQGLMGSKLGCGEVRRGPTAAEQRDRRLIG